MDVRQVAQIACDKAGIRMEVLHGWEGTDSAREIFDETWPGDESQATPNFLTAIVHAGGFVSVAHDVQTGQAVGACLAVVGRHKRSDGAWEDHLHSHLTAVTPEARDRGIGSAIKFHQRAWAHEQGIPLIGWTFDPLVRRNAWLNLIKLGAYVGEYLPNFYGLMIDELNANDESDRLYAWWRTDIHVNNTPIMELASGDVVVQLPEDIIDIRSTNAELARKWRLDVRDAMYDRLQSGWKVRGLTADHSYVLSKETP